MSDKVVDLLQTKNAFEVKADLPGVEKKDIKVNVDGDVLTISHERADKKEDKKEENGVKYHVSCLSSTHRLGLPVICLNLLARWRSSCDLL